MSRDHLDVSPRRVSVTGFNNVSLKCLAEIRPSDCNNNELQWRFFDRPLKSGEKYEIQERKTKTKCKRVLMITIFNIAYADEGTYSCSYSCESDHIISGVGVSMQLKVLSGMNNCVIISCAFSKGVRVREMFRYKEKGGKKINAEKCKLMTDEICDLSLSSVCLLQEIVLFILSHYFAKKRSCNV